MAIEAVLSTLFNVLVGKLVAPEVVGFFKKGRKVDNQLLRNLKIKMLTVSALLNDAEEKKMTNRDVQRWLDELKDAAYHADDILDEVTYEILRQECSRKSQLQKYLSPLTPAQLKKKWKLNLKLEGILKQLECLVQQNDTLRLTEKSAIHIPQARRVQTTSLLDDHVKVRSSEKEELVELLSHESSKKRYELISIVGLGGIGKTTLAQLAYNDERATQCFNKKVWLYVSDIFDERRLSEEILKKFDNSMKPDRMSIDELHTELEKALESEKILLVLDDVWTADGAQWEFLLKPFKSVAQGSKILVTTRDDTMASIRSADHRFQLQKLEGNDAWLLFANHAFCEEDPSAFPELNKIGRAIIQKCDGLPLALKALGGLLSCNRDALRWEEILNSPLWDQVLIDEKILPALMLSYHYMPSHLKHCFQYLAIFPKDYSIDQQLLVHLWMAEGLLTQYGQNIQMEDIGEKCIQDLVSRSFLQLSNDTSGCLSMHDLVNDLARFVFGDLCFRVEQTGRSRVPTVNARYLSFDGPNSHVVKDQIKNARTIFHSPLNDEITEAYLDLLTALRGVRVLHLPRGILNKHACPRKLPDSIGKLKHLRLINLSFWNIECLPDGVCNLYSLQTLILRGCQQLVELPDLFGNLKKLRYLDLSLTRKLV